MTRTVYLVSCTKTKAPSACAARDLYAASDWFSKARAYVEAEGAEWLILSAEYGLIRPTDVIEPYETTLLTMDPIARRRWAAEVYQRLRALDLIAEDIRFVMLAGETYRENLEVWLTLDGREPDRCAVPMRGMGMGTQKAWLAHRADTRPIRELLEGIERADLTKEAIAQRLAAQARTRRHEPMQAGSLFDEVARAQLDLF